MISFVYELVNIYGNNIYNFVNVNQDTNRFATIGNFDKYFTTEDKNYFIKTKKKHIIKFNKKKQNISLSFRVFNGQNIENKDIKCLILNKNSYEKSNDDGNFAHGEHHDLCR